MKDSKELYVGVGSTLIVASIPIVLVNSFFIFSDSTLGREFLLKFIDRPEAWQVQTKTVVTSFNYANDLYTLLTTIPGIIAGVAGITAGSLMIDRANQSEQ